MIVSFKKTDGEDVVVGVSTISAVLKTGNPVVTEVKYGNSSVMVAHDIDYVMQRIKAAENPHYSMGYMI